MNELQNFKNFFLAALLLSVSGCFFSGSGRLLVVEVSGPSGLPVQDAEVYLDEAYKGKTDVKGLLRIAKLKKLTGEQVLLTITKSNAYVEYVPYEDKVLLDISRRQFVSLELSVRGAVKASGLASSKPVRTKPDLKVKPKPKPRPKIKGNSQKVAINKAGPKPSARASMVESQLRFAEKAASQSSSAKGQSEKIMHANNAFHAAEDAFAAAKKLPGSAYVKALKSYRQTMDKLYKSVDHEPFRQKRDNADRLLLSH